jgi:hypothetical protein
MKLKISNELKKTMEEINKNTKIDSMKTINLIEHKLEKDEKEKDILILFSDAENTTFLTIIKIVVRKNSKKTTIINELKKSVISKENEQSYKFHSLNVDEYFFISDNIDFLEYDGDLYDLPEELLVYLMMC